jgi:hypothetical protein
MLDTRRCFLKNLAGVSSSFLIFQSSPPIPAPRRRKVRDLKTQVDASHPSEIFSVVIFKQTQEIEKLAKQLKNYAKS